MIFLLLTMGLLGISLTGFQSYRTRQSLSFDPRLTLLAGRNDVGKSAALRALRVFVEPQNGARHDFEMTFRWHVPLAELSAALLPQGSSSPELLELIGGQDPHTVNATFRSKEAGEPLQPSQLQPIHVELEEIGAVAEGEAGTALGWTEGLFGGGSAFIGELGNLARSLASNVSYVSPRRIDQGPVSLTPQPILDPDARNLTNVVAYLLNNDRPGAFARLEAFMHEAFPQIAAISTPMETGSAPPRAELHVVYEADRTLAVPLRSCGTGIEQMLALATGILTASEPRLFLIDEPQAYLHPAAERSLLSLLEQNEHHQYVIATHSGFFLNARPITQARLFTIENGSTYVNELPDRAEILSELGVTAADLWLADAVLWVEGSSELRVMELIVDRTFGSERRTVAVKAMPQASRFSSRSKRQAEATFRFCESVMEALAPLPVVVRFLFDSDEKPEELRNQIEESSGGRARFLSVRELENFFLDAGVLHAALRERCELVGLKPPSLKEVTDAFETLLMSTSDEGLYPGGPGEASSERIVGSEVLRRLYWDFARMEYDKVAEGEFLAGLMLDQAPAGLTALTDLLRELFVADQ